MDHETLEDGQVTIRERDSMKQERIDISEVANVVRDRVRFPVV
ncbi:MAG: His/Gly/Thr/Pro-type tRNA ligase C-terminal domain-containing protein [Flavobacteriales bacterium]